MIEQRNTNTTGKVGAALVVGGGVGGIQAALDLADSGYKVYLVEQSSSIGGTMPQLDKTFPTNDCSMCILSPKLVECGRHLNIDLITHADLLRIEGEPGRFKATIRKRARSVDMDKCVGCGNCSSACLTRYRITPPPKREEIEIRLVNVDREVLDTSIDRHGAQASSLIAIMQEVNDELRYLPEDALRYIAWRLDIPVSQVYHVATFYTAFNLTPRGEHTICLCMGTTCHVRGAARICDEIQRLLDVEPGGTTEDGVFTFETVNCLGACALAPVMVIDGEYHGNVTTAVLPKLLDSYREREATVGAAE